MGIFPKSTEFNKKIPKQKFYEKADINPALKRVFVEQISAIIWMNKLAESTINLRCGESVTEIEVFEIALQCRELDTSVLKAISRAIPYHILFLLEFEGKYQAHIGFKDSMDYSTEWLDEAELPLKITGLTLDSVYENFVRQIAGSRLNKIFEDESLSVSIERSRKREELEKKIAALKNKIRKEKQFNRQVEMNGELKKLREELEELK